MHFSCKFNSFHFICIHIQFIFAVCVFFSFYSRFEIGIIKQKLCDYHFFLLLSLPWFLLIHTLQSAIFCLKSSFWHNYFPWQTIRSIIFTFIGKCINRCKYSNKLAYARDRHKCVTFENWRFMWVCLCFWRYFICHLGDKALSLPIIFSKCWLVSAHSQNISILIIATANGKPFRMA